jgi:Fe2+ or Zn2+ uptake regulation protein
MAGPLEDEVDTNRREAELAKLLMGYLEEHPQAMDSVHGIAEWWVAREQVGVNVNTLLRVLQQLTAKGLLEEIQSTEGPLYRLHR